jgi:hypothetical protein
MKNGFNTWKTNGTYLINKNLPQEDTEGIMEEDRLEHEELETAMRESKDRKTPRY